jgi:hypothetical protein
VLGFPLGRSTLGSKISEGDHGRITVQLANSTKPIPEAMLQVQELVSDTIAKVMQFCESKYTQRPIELF